MSGVTSNGSLWIVSPGTVARRAIGASRSRHASARPIAANVIGSSTSDEKASTSSKVRRGFLRVPIAPADQKPLFPRGGRSVSRVRRSSRCEWRGLQPALTTRTQGLTKGYSLRRAVQGLGSQPAHGRPAGAVTPSARRVR